MRTPSASLVVRLTLWCTGVFSVCFFLVLGTFYFLIRGHFEEWTTSQLKEEMQEGRSAFGQGGYPALLRQFRGEEAASGGRFLWRVIDRSGQVIYEGSSEAREHLNVDPERLRAVSPGYDAFESVSLGDEHSLMVTYGILPDGRIVQVALELQEHEIWMRRFAYNILKLSIFALLLSVGIQAFVVRRALIPIEKMVQTAARTASNCLSVRMPLSGRGDEIDCLAESFNGMLERIDALVGGMRGVTDALAHDLRTPVAAIRGMAEVTLRERRDAEQYRDVLYQIIERVDYLLEFFNAILDVSEAEGGALAMRKELTRVDDIVEDTLETFAPVAESRGVRLEALCTPGLSAVCDRRRIAQVLANLLDNALKYTPAGGVVWLSAGKNEEGGVVLAVTDDGVGISEKDLPHVFERYYRGEPKGLGRGLGLSLVRGIVTAHGGRITVESSAGKGAAFRIWIPD